MVAVRRAPNAQDLSSIACRELVVLRHGFEARIHFPSDAQES